MRPKVAEVSVYTPQPIPLVMPSTNQNARSSVTDLWAFSFQFTSRGFNHVQPFVVSNSDLVTQ